MYLSRNGHEGEPGRLLFPGFGMKAAPEPPESRIGIDLVTISDVSDALRRHGDRYLNRIFTQHEVTCCRTAWGPSAASLAARWAAKEATIKVLQPAGRSPGWNSIEVRRLPSGACALELSGVAADLAERAGITSLSLSMTHEGPYAAAIVLGMCGAPDRTARRGSAYV